MLAMAENLYFDLDSDHCNTFTNTKWILSSVLGFSKMPLSG